MVLTIAGSDKDWEIPEQARGTQSGNFRPIQVPSGQFEWHRSGQDGRVLHLVFRPDPKAFEMTGSKFLGVHPPLGQYVHDRTWTANCWLARGLEEWLGLESRSDSPAWTEPTQLQLELPVVDLGFNGEAVEALLIPLGFQIDRVPVPDSPYHRLRWTGNMSLKVALSQLQILLCLLDAETHSWLAPQLQAIWNRAYPWLTAHPRTQYLLELQNAAGDRISLAAPDPLRPETRPSPPVFPEYQFADKVFQEALVHFLRESQSRKVLELGPGHPERVRFLLESMPELDYTLISHSLPHLMALSRELNRPPLETDQGSRLKLEQGSMIHLDDRLGEQDALFLHGQFASLKSWQRPLLGRNLLAVAQPKNLLLSESFSDEKSRRKFSNWCQSTATEHGYGVRFEEPPAGDHPLLLAFFHPHTDR